MAALFNWSGVNMRRLMILLAAFLIGLSGSQAFGFDLKGITDSASKAVSASSPVTGDVTKLVDSLTSGLGISSEQAAGGSAALLSMAKNQLSADQFGALTDKVPGLNELLGGNGGLAASALSQVSNMEGVTKAFSSLGLSPDMISQFAPMILKFLGDQGVESSLLSSLQGLWGAAS